MARCQCAGGSCSCLIVGGPGTTVSGSGTANTPYQIDSMPYYLTLPAAPMPPVDINIGGPGVNIGDRAVIYLTISQNTSIHLPGSNPSLPAVPPGAQVDIVIRNGGSPATQWVVAFPGVFIRWMAGPTLPDPDPDKDTWYTLLYLDDGTWAGQARVSA